MSRLELPQEPRSDQSRLTSAATFWLREAPAGFRDDSILFDEAPVSLDDGPNAICEVWGAIFEPSDRIRDGPEQACEPPEAIFAMAERIDDLAKAIFDLPERFYGQSIPELRQADRVRAASETIPSPPSDEGEGWGEEAR